MKDLAKVMNLPKEQREEAFAEDRQRILAAGGNAKTVLLYLRDYFEISRIAYLKAFESLPLDSELKEFQVVHQGLNALSNLESELNKQITAASRVTEPSLSRENEYLNA